MISVIIPVYNAGVLLTRILDEICEQTEQDYEVILINDGSTDGSGEVCNYYADRDGRFRVIHQQNCGVSAARNNGLVIAKGEYITFLDADDEIPRNYLNELLKTQRATGADIVVCDVAVLCEGKEQSRFTHEPATIDRTDALNLLLSRRRINSGPCAKLFRRECVMGLSFPELKVYEDILFVRDAFCKAERFAFTNKTEYCYLQNKKGAMHSNIDAPSLDVVIAADDIASFLCKHKELDPYCFYITLSHLFQYVQTTSDENTDNMFDEAARKTIRKFWKEIVKCDSFPWKEKVLFISFAFGLNLQKR